MEVNINKGFFHRNGGAQHSVILAWDATIKESFKRKAPVESEEKKSAAFAAAEELLNNDFDDSLFDDSSNGPLKLKSPNKISPNGGSKAMDRMREDLVDIDAVRSPPRKRPKMVFSRDVVNKAVKECKKLEKKDWDKFDRDPDIAMLGED